MKTRGGVDVELHAFLISTLDEGEWSAPRLGRFIPGERACDTHCTGSLMGPRSGLDAVAKKKSEWNRCRPARSLVTILTD